MPLVFRHRGYRFFFFSNEGTPREPLHIHVRKGGAVAKFWIQPNVGLADSYGFSSIELRRLARLIRERKDLIERSWHEHFDF
ncbi:MAG: DUF4160 domain-containing protein [bacterium]|nr:DUF4160 domain-containing protein [bacterium]